jgi:AraC-like DNA-binding protein
MTIPRRHHCANEPSVAARRTAPAPEAITVELTSPARADHRDCEISGGQLANLELMVFEEPLSKLAARLGSDPRLERLWMLIEVQYADPELTLERAAKASGLCANRLNGLLRKKAGLTFHQILVRYRLLSAAKMVTAGQGTTIQVAFKVGFGSVRAFERNFRKAFGLAPGRFMNIASAIKKVDFCRDS